MESELTPADRVRGVVATIHQMLAAAKTELGVIGPMPVEILFAVPTPQGMGVIARMPAKEFLADLDAVTSPAEGGAP